MGEIADMMLEGISCTICGVLLDDGKPYPHPCPACEDNTPTKDRKKKKGKKNGIGK